MSRLLTMAGRKKRRSTQTPFQRARCDSAKPRSRPLRDLAASKLTKSDGIPGAARCTDNNYCNCVRQRGIKEWCATFRKTVNAFDIEKCSSSAKQQPPLICGLRVIYMREKCVCINLPHNMQSRMCFT